MSNRFTPAAENALNQSLYLARTLGHTYIGTEHILLGLLSEKEGVAARILSLRGITYDKTHKALLSLVGSGIPTRISPDDMTPRARLIIEHAAFRAMKAGQSNIGTEHLLLGLLEEDECCAVRLLCAQRVTPRELTLDTERYLRECNDGKETRGSGAKGEEKEKSTQALKQYTRDLCAMAKRGEFDPLIGRDDELAHLIRILCRKSKNNPCLIGEPGVGKTAMAEGLAARIAKGDVPDALRNRTVFCLDLPAMIAGAKYRGEFEERMKNVMNEVKNRREVILFIDEIHTIVGAGSAEGAVDAANILKPALARGEIQVIGATTLEEYRRHVEKDGALARRFQPLVLAEPSPEQTLTILQGLRPGLQAHHGITIPDATLKRAVTLSVRYLPDRFLPDKAIDLLDEGGAALRMQMTNPPREEESDAFPDTLPVSGVDLFRFGDQAAAISEAETPRELTEEILEQILTEQTGIPVKRLDREEETRLLRLESLLSKRVIGQEEAISSIARALRRSRTGIASPNRPTASFLFLGPSGVGKSELARALAEVLFGAERALIRFDMSEYMEKHSVSRLIGSPPGYVGHEEGGQLSKAVRHHPYSVVLFDEIEKAHPDLFHLFLQILEEGEATDATGRKINFRSSILIFTSNLEAGGTTFLGFAQDKNASGSDEKRRELFERLKQYFRPELLGRLDEINVFRKLTEGDLAKIASLALDDLKQRVETLGITLTFDDALITKLAKEAANSKEGARPLRRLIRREVEDPLSEAILAGTVRAGDAYRACAAEEERVCTDPAKAR